MSRDRRNQICNRLTYAVWDMCQYLREEEGLSDAEITRSLIAWVRGAARICRVRKPPKQRAPATRPGRSRRVS